MKHSYIQLHVAILLAACSSIFGKLISLDAIFITFYRMLLAAVILFVVVISTRRTSGIGKSARGNILTGVLLALHWIMFYASIKFANVSIGVVCFCLTHPSAWECCAASSHHCQVRQCVYRSRVLLSVWIFHCACVANYQQAQIQHE